MKTVVKSLYREMESFGSKEVTVSGWVRTVRASNAFGFIELNDGSFFKSVQVVIEADKLENYTDIAKLNVGAAIGGAVAVAVMVAVIIALILRTNKKMKTQYALNGAK